MTLSFFRAVLLLTVASSAGWVNLQPAVRAEGHVEKRFTTSIATEQIDEPLVTDEPLTTTAFAKALLGAAQRMTEEEVEPEQRAVLLRQLAILHARGCANVHVFTNSAAAQTFLEQALQAARRIERPEDKSKEMAAIAGIFRDCLNDIHRMESVLEEILTLTTNADLSRWTIGTLLDDVAEQYVLAENYERAYQLPAYSEDPYIRGNLEHRLAHDTAQMAAEAGQAQLVKTFILNANFSSSYYSTDEPRPFPPPTTRVLSDRLAALRRLMEAYSRTEQANELDDLIVLHESIATRLPDGLTRATEYIRLSDTLLYLSKTDAAMLWMEKASQSLMATEPDSVDSRADYYQSNRATYETLLGKLYFDVGMAEEGIAITQKVIEDLLAPSLSTTQNADETLSGADFVSRIYRLMSVVSRLQEAEQTALIDEALEQVEHLIDSMDETEALQNSLRLQVATAYQSIDDSENMNRLVRSLKIWYTPEVIQDTIPAERFEWMDLLEAIGDYQSAAEVAIATNDSETLSNLTSTLVLAEERAQAEEILFLISEPSVQMQALSSMAVAYDSMGDRPTGYDTMLRVLDIARSNDLALDPIDLSEVQTALASAMHHYAEIAKPEEIKTLIALIENEATQISLALDYLPVEAARDIISQLPESEAKATAIEQLLNITSSDGCFHQSFSSVLAIEVPDRKALSLLNMAECYASVPPQPLPPEFSRFLQQLSSGINEPNREIW